MISGFLHPIERWAQAWFDCAVPLGLSACLAIGLVWAVTRILRRRTSAALRYALWLLVLARLALPALPILPVPLESVAAPLRQAFSTLLNHSVTGSQAIDPTYPFTGNFGAGMVAGGAGQKMDAAPPALANAPRDTPMAVTALFLLWLTGVVFWGVLNARRYGRLHEELRRLSPVTGGPDYDLFCTCRTRLAIPRWLNVQLYVSEGSSSPFVCGVIHPKIILPLDILGSFPPSQLEPLLLHELAHVKRWDTAVMGLQLLLQILHWPNPLVWLANRRLRVEREQACDDWVLAATRFERRDYGSSLVQVLEMTRCEAALSAGMLGVVESGGSLQDRLKQIMNGRRRIVTRLSPLARGGILVLGAVLLAIVPVVGQGGMNDGKSGPVTPAPNDSTAQQGKVQHAAGTLNTTLLQTITQERAIEPGAALELENSNGAVTVSAWEKPTLGIKAEKKMVVRSGGLGWLFGSKPAIKTQAEAERCFKELDVEISGDTKKTGIRTHFPERTEGVSYSVGYEIRLPARANLKLRTSNGAVSVSGIEGEVRGHSSNGTITIENVKGAVTAETSNGLIYCRVVRGKIQAHTSNGKIDCRDAFGDLDAQTSNGAIEVQLAGPLGPQERLTCRTSNGSIHVALPGNSSFNLQAHTSLGRISNDFPLTLRGDLGGRDVSGKVGAGGAEVNIRTTNGAIKIDAMGAAAAPASSTPAALASRASAAPEEQKVLAARQECFPQPICDALLELRRQASRDVDPAGKLEVNMLAESIDKKGELWIGIVERDKNPAGTMSGEIGCSNTDASEPILILSDGGEILKHHLERRKASGPGKFKMFITLDKPWPTGEEKSIYWIMRGGRPRIENQNEFSFEIQNIKGSEGLQQLMLVLPAGYRIKTESEPYHAAKDVGDNKIFLWQKHVMENENYRVAVVVELG